MYLHWYLQSQLAVTYYKNSRTKSTKDNLDIFKIDVRQTIVWIVYLYHGWGFQKFLRTDADRSFLDSNRNFQHEVLVF